MSKFQKLGSISFSVILMIIMLSSCKNNDPSILKVFVRSSSNELLEGAEVVVIGDLQSTPPTMEFVDTVLTNASGYVEINMDNYFSVAGEDNSTGYFDLIVKKNGKIGTAYVRCRVHLTTVETVYLTN